MQVSFKANYIDEIPLKYYKKGAFVELYPKNLYDLLAVREVADKWKTKLTNGILSDVIKCFNKSDSQTKFFAVTRQSDSFEELNSANILAIMETKDLTKDRIKISLLEVNPQNQKEGIGTSIINCLKRIRPNKDICAHPIESAINFYHKLGFKPENGLITWILKRSK